jgi:hypothetical protein
LKFTCSHDDVLAQLPYEVQRLFPCHLTHKSGVEIGLVQLLKSSHGHGLSAEKMKHILKEKYSLEHSQKRLAYYSLLESIKCLQRSAVYKAMRNKEPPLLKEFLIPDVFKDLNHFPDFKSTPYGGLYPSSNTNFQYSF